MPRIALSIALFFALLWGGLQCFAQVPLTGAGKGTPAVVAATFTPGVGVAPQYHGFAAGTVTFSNLNGGTNFPSGAVVVLGVGQEQPSKVLTSPQIGGNAAAIVSGSQNAGTTCTIYQATIPSSSPDNFTFTNGNAINDMGVAAGYFTGLSSSVVSAANSEAFGALADPQFLATAITVPSNGFGVGFVFMHKASASTQPAAMTWTNTTSGSGDIFSANSNGVSSMAVGLAHKSTSGSFFGGSGTGGVSGVTNNMNFAACSSGGSWS